MPEPSHYQWLKVVLLFILAGVIFIVAPPLVSGVLSVTLAVLGLTSTLLLKLGKLKPESPWTGETPLGGLLMAMGVLGFGLAWLAEAFQEYAAFEYRLPLPAEIVSHLPAEVVSLIALVSFFVGLRIEDKARKARKARSEEA